MPHPDANLAVTLQAEPAGPCLITASGELDYHTGSRLRACLDDVPLASGTVADMTIAAAAASLPDQLSGCSRVCSTRASFRFSRLNSRSCSRVRR